MQAIRAAHAFDGTRFLPGGATVLVEGSASPASMPVVPTCRTGSG